MSTKSSIEFEDGSFHLYHELIYDPGVYICIENPNYYTEIGEGHLQLPENVIEAIAKFYNKKQEEIKSLVKSEIEKEILETEVKLKTTCGVFESIRMIEKVESLKNKLEIIKRRDEDGS